MEDKSVQRRRALVALAGPLPLSLRMKLANRTLIGVVPVQALRRNALAGLPVNASRRVGPLMGFFRVAGVGDLVPVMMPCRLTVIRADEQVQTLAEDGRGAVQHCRQQARDR